MFMSYLIALSSPQSFLITTCTNQYHDIVPTVAQQDQKSEEQYKAITLDQSLGSVVP